jgi:hypothetical protein
MSADAAIKSDPEELASETLERILRLAAAERAARDSTMWRTDLYGAFEVHGAAVDALHVALYAELGRRIDIGAPIEKPKKPADPIKVAKQHILKTLRERLPDLISEALDNEADF